MFKLIKIVLLLFGSLAISVISMSQLDYGIPVLMYHHILPVDENKNFQNNAAVLNLEDFQRQMQYLYDNRFHTLTTEEVKEVLYDNKKFDDKCVWITFDDGYYSNLVYAYPILKNYGFSATVFVLTSYVTDDMVPFNADELIYLNWQEMSNYCDVFDFASHSDNMHEVEVNGLTKLENSTQDEVIGDIKKSMSYDKINAKYAFSYPYGGYNDEIINDLKICGVKIAVTVDEGYIKRFTNPYKIPRFNIYRGISFNRFKSIVK
ncbi:MAG: polysaccharide deacetylase family protein [Oscillospiraceae bacterium]|nr:polysaccharide deacetylase family protein [Oscillospiraceae bacterium]